MKDSCPCLVYRRLNSDLIRKISTSHIHFIVSIYAKILNKILSFTDTHFILLLGPVEYFCFSNYRMYYSEEIKMFLLTKCSD